MNTQAAALMNLWHTSRTSWNIWTFSLKCNIAQSSWPYVQKSSKMHLLYPYSLEVIVDNGRDQIAQPLAYSIQLTAHQADWVLCHCTSWSWNYRVWPWNDHLQGQHTLHVYWNIDLSYEMSWWGKLKFSLRT